VFRPDIAIRFFPAVHGIRLIRASAGFDDVMLKRAFPAHAATGARSRPMTPAMEGNKIPLDGHASNIKWPTIDL
jgi:hypothetical protein